MSDVQVVNEVPGLYGNLKVDEKTIQKIWADQNFNQSNLKTESGEKLKILSPGTWNKSEEGPDFKNASLLLDNREIKGDIEIHFQSDDWQKHRHHEDSNYNQVILHVTLFPSKIKARNTKSESEKIIPLFPLLQYLTQSLEELLEAQAIESLAGYKSNLPGNLLTSGILSEIKAQNYYSARDRWLQKKSFAPKRLAHSNHIEVFHQCFLEVLGYKRNRAPMNQLAQAFPTAYWSSQKRNSTQAFQSICNWKMKGLRPANHPHIRLKQYAQLWQKNPQWIESLQKLNIPVPQNEGHCDRKSLELSKLNKKWKNNLLCGVFGGTRINTLWIDACLPPSVGNSPSRLLRNLVLLVSWRFSPNLI